MINPSDIIKATGSDPSKPVSGHNPLGTGHIMYIGRIFKCAGTMQPNPDYNPAGPNAPAEILVQHVLMTLLDVPADGKAEGAVPTERADEAKWELDPAQDAMDPTNPVCQICHQPPVS